jgi:hypothetical protein|tara:strand:- start:90 stop:239 length:150 start_codon:yes stop_codon:yes gene_type:complete
MSIYEQIKEENNEFWQNASRYSWSKSEIDFVKEISFIMTYLHREDSKDQ